MDKRAFNLVSQMELNNKSTLATMEKADHLADKDNIFSQVLDLEDKYHFLGPLGRLVFAMLLFFLGKSLIGLHFHSNNASTNKKRDGAVRYTDQSSLEQCTRLYLGYWSIECSSFLLQLGFHPLQKLSCI